MIRRIIADVATDVLNRDMKVSEMYATIKDAYDHKVMDNIDISFEVFRHRVVQKVSFLEEIEAENMAVYNNGTRRVEAESREGFYARHAVNLSDTRRGLERHVIEDTRKAETLGGYYASHAVKLGRKEG